MSFALAAPWRSLLAAAAPARARGAVLTTPHLVPTPRRGPLFARFRKGDGAGFDAVVLVHLDAAYNLARYLAREGDVAEDVVQSAVLKAHKAFAGFRGGDAKAWLLTIVRREFIDWVNAKRAGRAVFAEGAGESEVEVASPEATPEQALLHRDTVGAVRRAIEALPEPFREAIVLRELEELSYAEVAAITGAPLGTVMSRLARGREMLARALAQVVAQEGGR